MHDDLKGKVALVTGGARDIGRAISLGLSDAGAAVAINYHSSADAANKLVDEIKAKGGKAIAIKADVSRAEDAERLVAEACKAFGDRIDVLVNNAGGLIARKKLEEMDTAFWDNVLALNLRSVFLVTKAASPHLGGGSAIVN